MLNKEDKSDVSRAFGKGVANTVHRATNDSKSKALKKSSGQQFNEDRFHKHGSVSVRKKDFDSYKHLEPSKVKFGKHKTLGEYAELSK